MVRHPSFSGWSRLDLTNLLGLTEAWRQTKRYGGSGGVINVELDGDKTVDLTKLIVDYQWKPFNNIAVPYANNCTNLSAG
jgi:hypothetical protein